MIRAVVVDQKGASQTQAEFSWPEATFIRSATISDDNKYRYDLSRRWREKGKTICWVMLNPSTADDAQDDPTIRRCINFSKNFGFSALVVVNLFAGRATDPRELLEMDDPVGPANQEYVGHAVQTSETVVMAWGASLARVRYLPRLQPRPPRAFCLGRTRDGFPRHPLYVPQSQCLVPYI